MDRMGVVFLACVAIAVVLSLLASHGSRTSRRAQEIDYSTTTGFNVAAVSVVAILIALYAIWW